jgi:exopolyphosphatase/guanosine-5'-triphosphate,3'-diphosphate pyrophosphatase
MILYIEIGTNSIKSLYDDLPDDIWWHFTRLGEGLFDTFELSPIAIDRTISTISQIIFAPEKPTPEKVYIVATEALRIAKNTQQFIEAMEKKIATYCDFQKLINFKILTPTEEAYFAYIGGIGIKHQPPTLLIDIGGGSTELAIMSKSGDLRSMSYSIGAVKLKESLSSESPPHPELIQTLSKSIDLQEMTHLLSDNQGLSLCGIGGTLTTLASIYKGIEKHDNTIINGTTLQKDSIIKISDKIKNTPLDTRTEKIAGLYKGREDIIWFGIQILLYVMDNLQIKKVSVSTRGVIHGFLEMNV